MRLPKRKLVTNAICSKCTGRLQCLSTPRPGLKNVPRTLHTSRTLRDDVRREPQAQPLGEYYADLLATPIPKPSKAHAAVPTFVQSGDETKEARAAKVFGTIEGSGYERRTSDTPDETWRTINGVPVPPRPAEPDNCCMSGCVHCVWDDYRDDVEGWAGRVHEAQAKAQGRGMHGSPKAGMQRTEVMEASSSMDEDGGGSEGLWDGPSATSEEERLFEGIPVGIRYFMETEKRLRERKRIRREKNK